MSDHLSKWSLQTIPPRGPCSAEVSSLAPSPSVAMTSQKGSRIGRGEAVPGSCSVCSSSQERFQTRKPGPGQALCPRLTPLDKGAYLPPGPECRTAVTASPGNAGRGEGHCRMEGGQPLTGFSLQERGSLVPPGGTGHRGSFLRGQGSILLTLSPHPCRSEEMPRRYEVVLTAYNVIGEGPASARPWRVFVGEAVESHLEIRGPAASPSLEVRLWGFREASGHAGRVFGQGLGVLVAPGAIKSCF